MTEEDESKDVSEQVTTTPGGRRGVGKNELAEAYLPGEDEWSAKTILDLEDPHRIATLRQFDKLFPEVEELQPVIDEFLEEFLPAKTSINGASRQEATEILKAMHGSGTEESNAGAQLAAALGADVDND